jgi:signal transduction histidine kinase
MLGISRAHLECHQLVGEDCQTGLRALESVHRFMCCCLCHSFRASVLVLLLVALTLHLSEAGHAPVLTNAAQVRALSPADAAKRVPVRLRGLAMDNRGDGTFALLDGTEGIYAAVRADLAASFARGDWIEVEGVSDPGEFAPFVKVSAVRKLGVGRIPEPRLATRDDLLSGRADAQWIELSGVVRQVESVWNGVNMEVELENGAGRMLAHVHSEEAWRVVPVDSMVRLRGICFYQLTKNRQVLRPYLILPIRQPILVTEPAVTNLSALPVRSIESLGQFNNKQAYAHRMHVRGVVIHSEVNEGLWLRDAGSAIRVVCSGSELPTTGKEVDVHGFLKREEMGLLIEDAIFQETGNTIPVKPILLTKATEALDHDSDLVECDAVIREFRQALDGVRLGLSEGSNDFSAVLHISDQSKGPRHWLPGARIRVAGVCGVEFLRKPTEPGFFAPQTFHLLLRSPADVQMVQPPSWWSAEHVAWLTGGVAVTLLGAVGVVVWMGRRRLREQAVEQMKTETEFAAILNERNRMAREIHDTLSQGLSAISMQLEVVKRQLPPGGKARELLEAARELARTNLTAARNAIWNVRSQDLETGNLATALGAVLRNLTEGTETRGELRVKGHLRRLSPLTENNLLRIGSEAVTNAAKYAEAQNILVTLDYEVRQFQMSVSDDGKGFDPQHPPPSEGGFGLKAMRDRAELLHAEFSVMSEPGSGTLVMLTLPLPQ